MSKKIKTQMQIMKQSNKICQSMSNLSAVKMMSSKKKIMEFEKQLVLLGGIYYQVFGNLKKDHSTDVIMYSNFGFVGGFNEYKTRTNQINVGRKGKGRYFRAFDNFLEFFIDRNLLDYNFVVMDFFSQKELEISINNYIKPSKQEFIIECEKSQISENFYKKFLEYVYYFYIYQENIHRNQVMKSAAENSEKWYKDLYIKYNKQRQMSLTQEILLIVSGNN